MAFSKYPESLDDSGTLPVSIDNVTPVTAEVVNRLRSSVISTQAELGTIPSGTFGTVRARLDALDTVISNLEISIGGESSTLSETIVKVDTLETNISLLSATLTSHLSNTSNPHSTTAAAVGAPNLVLPSTDTAVVRFSGIAGQMQNSSNGPYVDNTGELRIINNVSISARNFADSSWLNVAKLNTSNQIEMGTIGVTDILINTNGTVAATINNSSVTLNGYLQVNSSLGTTSFPGSGSIRLKGGVNNNGIFFQSVLGSAVPLVTHDASDNINIGLNTAGSMGSLYLNVPTGESTFFRINNISYLSLDETELNTIIPVKMTEQASDPTITSNTGSIYTKESDSITELFYQSSDGTVTQLTRGLTSGTSPFLDIRDFGAVPSVLGGGNAIQDAIDEFINNSTKYLAIYIPPGLWSITQPLICIRGGGGVTKVTMVSSGYFPDIAGSTGQTVIKLEGDGYQDWPVLIIQGNRGSYFEGITFYNTGNDTPFNNFQANSTNSIYVYPDVTDWYEPTTRVNLYSPSCCVALDPFVDGYPAADINNAYPGLEDYYGGPLLPTPGGSSHTTFKHCSFWGGFVGVSSSSAFGANNENNMFDNCYFVYNTYHYACGQSQERANVLREPKTYGSWCAFTTELVGPGGNSAIPPFIYGANIGGCRYVFDINCNSRVTYSNFYMESVASLGKLGTSAFASQGGILLDGFAITFATADDIGLPTLPEIPFHLETRGMVEISNSRFANASGNTPIYRIHNIGGRLTLRNFQMSDILAYKFNVPIGFYQLNTVRGTPWQTYGNYAGVTYHDDPVSEIEELNIGTAQIIAVGGDDSKGTMAKASTANLRVGDLIRPNSPGYTPQSIASEPTTAFRAPVGEITSITIDTEIEIDGLPYGFAFSTVMGFDRLRWVNYSYLTSLTSPTFIFDIDYDLQELDGSSPEEADAITAWGSIDSTKKILEQDTLADRPIYDADFIDFNHEPGLLFGGTAHLEYLGAKSSSNILHNGAGASVTVAFQYDSANPGVLISSLDNSANNIGFELEVDGSGDLITRIGNGSGSYLVNSSTGAATLLDGYVYAVSVVHSTTGSPQYQVRVNNVVEDSGSYTGSASASDSTSVLTLGARPGGVSSIATRIYAFIITSAYQSATNLSGLELYLLNKVGQ